MKLEPCAGCGRICLTHPIANLVVKCDPAALDGQGVAQELTAGRQIWTPEFGPGLIPQRLRGARPGDTRLLREHHCMAAGALHRPSPVLGDTSAPKGRETGAQSLAAPSTPSVVRPTEHSSASGAVPRRSEEAGCSFCGQPLGEDGAGTYVIMQLGATVVDAFHSGGCP